MKLPISPRLLACAGLLRPGDRVADVGCDHGYLGIHLLLGGIAAWVYAADIHEQPLRSAGNNAKRFGVEDRMSFFLSDGLEKVPRDFDVLVCAGMGADTMVSILEAAPWLREGSYRLVLQCQSKTFHLRRYLSDAGWTVSRELACRDGRFCYTVMEARYDPLAPRLTPGGCWFTPAFLSRLDEAGRDYGRRQYQLLNTAVACRAAEADPWLQKALEETQSNPLLTFLKEATI